MMNASRLMVTPVSRAVALALGAWGLVGAGAAFAQAAPAAPAADSGELSTVTVTVTATRRIEDQQKVSTSVTALSAEKPAKRNIYDISQFDGLTPDFTFGRSGSDARPAMRVVRTEAVQQNADTTIGFFIDDIYKSRASQALARFVDLERVEVQRGPQGALFGRNTFGRNTFGRNTFGGNIVLTTVRPELGETSAKGSLLLNSFKRVRVEAVGNIPVAPTVAIRLAGAVDWSDGYVKNDFNKAARQDTRARPQDAARRAAQRPGKDRGRQPRPSGPDWIPLWVGKRRTDRQSSSPSPRTRRPSCHPTNDTRKVLQLIDPSPHSGALQSRVTELRLALRPAHASRAHRRMWVAVQTLVDGLTT